MPRTIAILPDAVADQIAAGEVVERPASVVKELVENAIDAGASHIAVELEQGGKKRITVRDDGSGMNREDAILALERHATSKITTAADLVGVPTLGFRGEALPSIASVSRSLLSTSDGDTEGTEITVAGGRIEQVKPVARQRGTTVSVQSLFYNTPARRKFLRSVSSETRASHDVVATLALAHPAIGFELTIDERLRLQVPANQALEERLIAVWGQDLAGTLIPLAHAVGRFKVEGFAQRPADASPSGRRTLLLINGRPFKDAFLIRAAEAGYRAAIHPGDRPSLCLSILTDPQEVDVNVHPAKREVRFRDRYGAERAVEEAVHLALGEPAAAARVGSWRPMPGMASAGGGDAASLFAPMPGTAAEGTSSSEPGHAGDQAGQGGFGVPLLQLFDTYICYEAPEGMVIVDQHSAHERVLYENVMAHLSGGDPSSQRLLLPITVELTDEELEVVEEHRDHLVRIGFEVEEFGGRSVIITATPAPHPRFDALECFREMVADLARGRFGGWANQLERFAATYACRAAVKAGQSLGEAEMRQLLLRLFETELPPHDVHGRATIVQLPKEELERRFGRR
jgi:DNA mismatch repair protein MutL